MINDCFVRLVPFPKGVLCNGMVTPNSDGTYSIYLNSNATWEQQCIAYQHEIEHIQNNDLYNSKQIKEIECI